MPIKSLALTDTGASYSFISAQYFFNIQNNQKYIRNTHENITIITGNDKINTKAQRAMIPITFHDKKGNQHTFKHYFYIVEELTQDCYLGSDILFNKHRVKSMNHNGIKLRIPNKQPMIIPFNWRKSNSAINLLCAEEVEIPPHQIVQVKTFGNKFIPTNVNLIIDDIDKPDHDNYDEYERVIDEYFDDLPTYSVMKKITQRSPDNTYDIFIENNSYQFMALSLNSPVAQIKQEDMELYSLSIDDSSNLLIRNETNRTAHISEN